MDILDTDLTDVSTKYSVLPAGAYEFTANFVREPSKDGKGELIKITLKTLTPCKDRDGKDVFAGHVITDRISLTQTEKYTRDMILKRLKQVGEAIFGEGQAPAKTDLVLMEGKTLMAKIKVDTDSSGEYDDSNKIAKYIPKEV